MQPEPIVIDSRPELFVISALFIVGYIAFLFWACKKYNYNDMSLGAQNLYNENSIFRYGTKHRGKLFKDIPASYLLWVLDNKVFLSDLSLHAYIEGIEPELREKAKSE